MHLMSNLIRFEMKSKLQKSYFGDNYIVYFEPTFYRNNLLPVYLLLNEFLYHQENGAMGSINDVMTLTGLGFCDTCT